ncbi:MAG: transporter [Paenibacillus sp.]|nr:transporter [Paenibacillus sp.]
MRKSYLLLLALFLASLNLRPAITSIAPMLETIRETLGISGTTASLLTSIPVMCMGLFAPTAVLWSRRLGLERTILFAVLLIGGATAARFFAGTAFILLLSAFAAGVGIAVAGPLLSGFIKKHFAAKASSIVGIYSMALVLGATVSAGLSVPLQAAFGNSWQASSAAWAVFALAALPLWIHLAAKERRNRLTVAALPPAGIARLPLRDKRAWLLTCYFGLMAFEFYSITAWLSPTLESMGYDASFAAAMLTLFTFIQIPVSLLIPFLMSKFPKRLVWLLASASLELIGLVTLALSGNPWLAAVLLGLGAGGLFPIALMLPIEETPDAESASSWSAMNQSGGYVIGALGPVTVGYAHDLSGSFAPAFGGLAFLAVVMMVVQLRIGNRKPVPSVNRSAA